MHLTPRTVAVLFTFSFFLFFSSLPAHAAPGDLVKLACPAGADPNHPCRAVYFHGGDGRRHAFPNERTYSTWYANFSTVKTIDSAAMSALPLGNNVSYRPGTKLVKFITDNRVYAVGADRALRWVQTEAAATALYGANWSTTVDDIPDAFYVDYRSGADVPNASAFDVAAEKAAAPTIDAVLDDPYRPMKVATERGTFDVQVAMVRKDRFAMRTEVAANPDCVDGCAAKPLADYATDAGALIGIHGTYFCPPDYSSCAGKTNTFLSPVFKSSTQVMYEPFGLQVHQGPLLVYGADGQYRMYLRATESGGSVATLESKMGTTLVAAIANHPALVKDGVIIVESEPLLEEGQRTVKATRAGLGFDGTRVMMVVAKSATVVDLASIMRALGATDALNLDGGGSTALLYGGAYKAGPGRLLPNAVMFVPR